MMGEYGYPSAANNVYGQNRPTFGEDGTGMPYNSLLNMVGSSVLNQDISYDTSSKDPIMIRARVFIGNLVRAGVTRDDLIDLCKPFGRLLAVTFFKGYAFVQFSEAQEADTACTSLNGKKWRGTIIDVHLAMSGPAGGVKKPVKFEDSSRKRRYDDYSRDETSVLDETAEQNRRNRDAAVTDKTTNDELADSAMADTLICGGCRFVTCDYEVFKDHRIAGCRNLRVDGEPKSMRCASCSQRFLSAWALMCHLTDFHRMQLYREDDQSFLSNADTEATKSLDPVPAKRPASPSPFFSPIDSSKSVPVNSPLGAHGSVAPIGQSASTANNASHDASLSSANTSGASDGQWNPMTGQTIVATAQTIPSLAGGVPSVYGMR